METDPTRMCELLVGLGSGVEVVGVEDVDGEPLRVHVRLKERPTCSGCGGLVRVKGREIVELVDRHAFDRQARLVWHKTRWRCPDTACGVGSFVDADSEIAPAEHLLTTRASRWVCEQVGRFGRPVSDLATELGVSWHTINDCVIAWGDALLEADVDRVGSTTVVGLDETLAVRRGVFKHRVWATTVADVETTQLIDIFEGRDAASVCAWFAGQDPDWVGGIDAVTLDMASAYLVAANTMLPEARQIVDRFHLIRLCNRRLDECRRRIQNQTLGHRGRKGDPLYRIRRRLTIGIEHLDPDQIARVHEMLDAGDESGHLRQLWFAKEQLRALFNHPDRGHAAGLFLVLIQAWKTAPGGQLELRALGRTLWRWRHQILGWFWHHQISNGPTESVNNLLKRVKRGAFGFRNLAHYRIRALLYAGRPNWALLATITPR